MLMKKRQRYMLWIMLSFAIIFFVTYRILNNVNDGRTKPIEYPESTLSQDLFVSQNTEYVVNESLQDTYSFTTVPYKIDVVKGATADVESGHLINVADDVTIFMSEYPKSDDLNEVILNQYPPSIYINYSKENSYAQLVSDNTGYMNGYYARYFIDHLLISVGPSVTAQSVYMLGYDINLGSEYDNNLIIAITTSDYSTEGLALCKQYLDAFVYTLRYDTELAEELERKAQQEAREAEQKAKLEASDSSISSSSSEQSNYPVEANRDFKNMSVVVSWDRVYSGELSMDIQNANGASIVKESNITSKQALFECGQTSAGTYYVNCPNLSDLGSIKIKLIENGGF